MSTANSVLLAQTGSVASASNTSVTIAIPTSPITQSLELSLTAVYAAVAGTTGTTFSFSFSQDNSTFNASGVKNVVIANGAGVRADQSTIINLRGAYENWTGLPILYVKVTITNADTSNAVQTAVLAQFHTGLV